VSALTPLANRFGRAVEVLPLVAFRGLNGGMPLLLGLYIGYCWGLAELGAYTLASSFVAIGLMVVDWGCTRWLPRELALARVQDGTGSGVATANTMRLILAVAFLLLTAVLALTGRIPAGSARFALELGLLYPVSIFSVNGVSDRIVAREIAGIGGAVASGLAVFAIGAWCVMRVGSGPHVLVLAYVTGKVVESVFLMRGRTRLFHFVPRHVPAMAFALWPFSVQAIVGVIYARLSVFIVEHFRHADLGLVGVATALQNVLLLLPVSIGLLNYPLFTTAAAKGDRHRIRTALGSAVALSLAGVAAGVAVLVAGRNVIARVFHVTPGSMLFVIVFASIAGLTTGAAMSGLLLQALGRERTTAKLSFVTLAASLVAQFTFVQWLGLWGVAAGIATAELVSFCVFGIAAFRAFREKVPSRSGHAIEVPAPESLLH
jgi:O-antigen/teichoic acid export membrane protein